MSIKNISEEKKKAIKEAGDQALASFELAQRAMLNIDNDYKERDNDYFRFGRSNYFMVDLFNKICNRKSRKRIEKAMQNAKKDVLDFCLMVHGKELRDGKIINTVNFQKEIEHFTGVYWYYYFDTENKSDFLKKYNELNDLLLKLLRKTQ